MAIVVTLPQQPQANDVIGNTILELGAHAVSAAPYVPPVTPASDQYWLSGNDHRRGTAFRYALPVMGKQIQVETPLVGRHQLRNVALAIAAAEELSKQGFAITADSIEQGIRETQWPGRFQIVAAPKMPCRSACWMWRTILRERGRCVRRYLRRMKDGR